MNIMKNIKPTKSRTKKKKYPEICSCLEKRQGMEKTEERTGKRSCWWFVPVKIMMMEWKWKKKQREL